MSRFCFLLLCFFLVGWPAAQLPAASSPGTERIVLGPDKLEEIFSRIIREHVPADLKEDIRIEGFSSVPDSLTVPAGRVGHRLVNQVHGAYTGKKYLTVIITSNGKNCGEIKMTGTLLRFGDIVTAARYLPRRTVISEEDLTVSYRDVSQYGDDFIRKSEQVVGMELKTSLRAGTVLNENLVRPPNLIKRGDTVTIMARSGPLQITTPGEAKNAGARGETIRVKNLKSRRIVHARVVEEGLVEVDL